MSRIKKILSADLSAFSDGKKNFDTPKEDVERLAAERLEKSKKCRFFKKEPITWLRVNDRRLPEASGKYCENCGCIMSYKLRQNTDKCECWDED
jgi:hypothetical protein